jgi:hypothetical protein
MLVGDIWDNMLTEINPFSVLYTLTVWTNHTKHALEIMDKLYSSGSDGHGDEDNSQTSAWYVFSAGILSCNTRNRRICFRKSHI